MKKSAMFALAVLLFMTKMLLSQDQYQSPAMELLSRLEQSANQQDDQIAKLDELSRKLNQLADTMLVITDRLEPEPILAKEAGPTPYDQIVKCLHELNLKPDQVFVDVGVGADARVAIAAAGLVDKVYGIEIDPDRVKSARQAVADAGLSDKITIIEADANDIDFSDFDVAFAYLYPEVLDQLKSKLTSLDAFATFTHPVPNLDMEKIGESYIWRKPTTIVESRPYAWYNNTKYYGACCDNPRCTMRQNIMAQLAAKVNTEPVVAVAQTPKKVIATPVNNNVQYVSNKVFYRKCKNGKCYTWSYR